MKITILILATLSISVAYSQDLIYPGKLEIRDYAIGDKVKTKKFTKLQRVWLPSTLDGWTLYNFDYESGKRTLPHKYKELPVAVWQSTKDTNVLMTLMDGIILNFMIKSLSDQEKNEIQAYLNLQFKGKGQELHAYKIPQNYNVEQYFRAITWKTNDVIVQLGYSTSDEDIGTGAIRWNLIYSDFRLERALIDAYFSQR